MASTVKKYDSGVLEKNALSRLGMHFTSQAAMKKAGLPIIVGGDGCYLFDADGKKYLDALAGILSVQIGYGYGEEMAKAATAQLEELPFYTNWTSAHPRAIELATRLVEIAPGMDRAIFTSGGAEGVEAAWKLARQYFYEKGEHRFKAIAREGAYHGVTMGALSLTGLANYKAPFEPLLPGGLHVSNTNRFRRPKEETEAEFNSSLLAELEQTIEENDPETIAMIIMEPIQNVGGFLTPPAGYWEGLRELCDRYHILLVADETISGFGRLGYWFASERYNAQPDIITCAKGLSSSYGSIGAVLANERVWAPFDEPGKLFLHGVSFGGAPLQAALALKNLEIMEREGLLERVRNYEGQLKAELDSLRDVPIVGDVRGTGYAWGIELVSDPDTLETFEPEQANWLLRDFVSPRFLEHGLICRSDDRDSPDIMLSPPLVAGPEEFKELGGILRLVLTEASERLASGQAG